MEFKEYVIIFRDIIVGLSYMHTNTLAHRDIKPGNILRMNDGKYVLMDFGVGINLSNEENYDENKF